MIDLNCSVFPNGSFYFIGEIMKIKDASRYLRVHQTTIRRLIKERKLRILADGSVNSEDLELIRLEWQDRLQVQPAKFIKHAKNY